MVKSRQKIRATSAFVKKYGPKQPITQYVGIFYNPLTGMTGSSLYMQWPQSHVSFLKETNWFFVTDKTPVPRPNRVLY
jgi:hypothetical protein